MSETPVLREEAGGEGPSAPLVLGKVASPPNKESTCERFFFWTPPDVVVEKTQIVEVTSQLGSRAVTFYALVDEVYRQGRRRSIAESADAYDGDVAFEPPLAVPGITYASATILRTEPVVLAPPLEGSDVRLGGREAARAAYAADEIEPDKRLPLGVIKNGGTRTAGPGFIDLDYLLGENGGHLNVNGVAGRGTKSSFLLHVNYLLLRLARRLAGDRPADPDRLKVAPIILNVKNFDLFHIDRPSRRFDATSHAADWRELEIDDPAPFENVTYFAPQEPRGVNAVSTGRPGVRPYSWGLSGVIEAGLFPFLFAEDDVEDDNFGALVLDVQNRLTREALIAGEPRRTLDDQGGAARTFGALIDWVEQLDQNNQLSRHHSGTRSKFRRRLYRIVHEGAGVLRRDDPGGHPLDVRANDTRDPFVIDLSALAGASSLQRFVVAAIFRQLVEARTGSRAVRGLRYLVTLDELNRFAPRNSSDPVTRLIETVAAEMRSQGIILLGAQQQASLVSTRVFENAGIKALGRSGTMELGRDVWRFVGESARQKAAALDKTEKLLIQDNFREPMLVRVPMPPWALNPQEAGPTPARDRVRDEFDKV